MNDFYKDRNGWQARCKPCFSIEQRDRQLRRKYGISAADYTRMVEAQGHRCPICSEQRKLVVDHCHRSGRVRALLCDRCNRLLGVVDDDPALLRAALRFLSKHQS